MPGPSGTGVGPRAGRPGRRRMAMKCQKCAKPATYHITDIERGKPREFHFCDEHARQHLSPRRGGPLGPGRRRAGQEADHRRARRGPRAVAGRQAVLPALPDHLPGVPQLGPPGLPARLRGLPRRADAPAGEHPRRDAAFRQGPPPRPAQQPAADDADPAPQRPEADRSPPRTTRRRPASATRSRRSSRSRQGGYRLPDSRQMRTSSGRR